MNTRNIGSYYEKVAADYLAGQGYLIRERNYHAGKFGEIDLIAQKEQTLVFVEVKYRKSPVKGYPQEAVSGKKQRRICRVADHYLIKNGYHFYPSCRFDVISILGDQLRHIPNAFEYQPIK